MLAAAVAAAIMVGGSTALFHGGSAEAQVFDSLRDKQKGQQRQQRQRCQLEAVEGQRSYSLSADECAAVAPVLQAIAAGDWAAARAAVPAAQAAARGSDARYVVAQALLRIGIETQDERLQAQAVDDLIASGGAQPNEMRALYENQLGLALAAGDTAKAEQAQARLDALNPNDPARFVRQAQIRIRADDSAGAIALYQQAIQAAQAAGQAVPPEWRRQIAGLAYQARLPDTLRYMREWLEASPSPGAWHDTLAIYAEQGGTNALKLDAYRLMRAAGALTSERDFVQYAEAANEARAFGEVVAVLEEGFSRNAITTNAEYARGRLAQAGGRVANDRASLPDERRAALAGRDGQLLIRLADAYFGYGQYAEAAELYRAALDRGVDANVANTRLGAALALAGQRAQAEAAFGAVSGPREELAELWLLWLSRRG
jgi:tetratricopeptide (TPR) repeat protein